MKLHRIAAIVERHVYEARHNPERITDAFYWPVIDIVIWGFVTLYLARHSGLRPGVIGFLLGAAILWSMFRSFQRDMADGFLSEVWSRNLVGLFTTPLSVPEYIAGLVAINALKALLGTIVAALVARLCYNYAMLGDLPALLPCVLMLALFGLATGILVTGLIFRYTTRIQSLAWTVTGLIMPFSCVFYPLSDLPPALQALARLLPTTYSFEGMRRVMAGVDVEPGQFVIGFALDAVYLAIAFVAFDRLFHAARSRGLLVKVA